ncbi:hypothetical protein [Fulvimarina sp. MAC3]|uniref:hypothetical protein n=1 Tax=Fulvimarina sp. MAC3 TaxID=3148887 RepID=UPI0031FDA217
MPQVKPSRAALAICACLALSGCQSTGFGAGGSGGSSRLAAQTSDYERTIIEGATAGALIGGVGAAIATKLGGGSSRDIARNGAIGTVLGGLIGGAGGYGVAESKKSYVATEDQLQAVIRQAKISNGKLTRLVATADALVRQRRAEAKALDRSSRERRRDLRNAVAEDQRNLSTAIAEVRENISTMRALKGRFGPSRALDAEINQAEAKRSSLTKSQAGLNAVEKAL